MLGMAINSAKLFFAGKLFKDYGRVLRLVLLAVGLGAVVIVVAGQVAPVWVAALLGGLVAGALQPILFKNLKYA